MKRLATALALTLAPSFAAASPIGQFTETFFFGDSYTDGGAAFDLAGESAVPPAIYPQKQFTNGSVWATQLGATYTNGTYTANTGFTTTNFAVGGAEAVAEPDDPSPDLGMQIGTFLNYVSMGRIVPSGSLGLILIGANDFREVESMVDLSTGPSTDIGAELIDAARKIGADVIDSILAGTTALLNGGISKVAVFGLPDLGSFPSVDDIVRPFASAYTPEYNAELKTRLDDTFSPDQYMFVDTFAIFDSILQNPNAFGIVNTTDPCIENAVCLFGDSNSYFFYDSIHATEGVHQVLAGAVRDQLVAPIPLPASTGLLLAALASLLLLRRKEPAG